MLSYLMDFQLKQHRGFDAYFSCCIQILVLLLYSICIQFMSKLTIVTDKAVAEVSRVRNQ